MLALLCAFLIQTQPPRYQVLDIAEASAFGSLFLNDSGWMAGNLDPGRYIAVTEHDLKPLPVAWLYGDNELLPQTLVISGMNNKAQLIGRTYKPSSNESEPAWYDGGGAIPLPLTRDSEVYDINDAGVIVGTRYFLDSEHPPQAFTWQGGKVHYLSLPGKGSEGLAINNKGDIVVAWGEDAPNGESTAHIAILKGGKLTEICKHPFGWIGRFRINDSDDVVGVLDGVESAYGHTWIRGVHEELGLYVLPHSINDKGEVALELTKYREDAPVPGRPVGKLLVNGKQVDLNSFVDRKQWRIISAEAINNKGEIACKAYNARNEVRALLLKPVTK